MASVTAVVEMVTAGGASTRAAGGDSMGAAGGASTRAAGGEAGAECAAAEERAGAGGIVGGSGADIELSGSVRAISLMSSAGVKSGGAAVELCGVSAIAASSAAYRESPASSSAFDGGGGGACAAGRSISSTSTYRVPGGYGCIVAIGGIIPISV
jgi:hypothetical protein